MYDYAFCIYCTANQVSSWTWQNFVQISQETDSYNICNIRKVMRQLFYINLIEQRQQKASIINDYLSVLM